MGGGRTPKPAVTLEKATAKHRRPSLLLLSLVQLIIIFLSLLLFLDTYLPGWPQRMQLWNTKKQKGMEEGGWGGNDVRKEKITETIWKRGVGAKDDVRKEKIRNRGDKANAT